MKRAIDAGFDGHQRAYEPPSAAHDGYRVLLDRLWPRGHLPRLNATPHYGLPKPALLSCVVRK